MGISAVFAAASIDMRNIVIVDLLDSRLELAKTLGATASVNGKDPGEHRSASGFLQELT